MQVSSKKLEKVKKEPAVWLQVGKLWYKTQSNHSKQKGHRLKQHLRIYIEMLQRTKKIMIASCLFLNESVLKFCAEREIEREEASISKVASSVHIFTWEIQRGVTFWLLCFVLGPKVLLFLTYWHSFSRHNSFKKYWGFCFSIVEENLKVC